MEEREGESYAVMFASNGTHDYSAAAIITCGVEPRVLGQYEKLATHGNKHTLIKPHKKSMKALSDRLS